jgi:hypothetical protein
VRIGRITGISEFLQGAKMPPKTFSLKEVVIAALVSFLLSGVGGALFNEYMSRAKPSISLISVAFKGPPGLIEMPADLISAVEKTRLDPIQKHESFNTLLARHHNTLERIARLEEGIGISTTWVDESEKAGETKPLTRDDIEKMPFVKSQTVGEFLLDIVQADKPPPHSLQQLKALSPISSASEDDAHKMLSINYGTMGITIPITREGGNYETAFNLLQETLRRGDRQNLIYYHKQFLEEANRLVRTLKQVEQLLRQLLIPRARLDVDAFLSNTGRDTVVMKPFFALVIDHPDFRNKPLILSTVSTSNVSKTGTDVEIPPLLPESSATPYYSLEAGKSRSIHAAAVSPIGEDASKIVQIYSTGILNCRIVAFTESGDSVKSPHATFGSKINEADRQLVERQAMN